MGNDNPLLNETDRAVLTFIKNVSGPRAEAICEDAAIASKRGDARERVRKGLACTLMVYAGALVNEVRHVTGHDAPLATPQSPDTPRAPEK
jgi:hypothetical protein